MKTKTLILSLVVLIFIASGMSQLELRTENDIQSYSSFNMNGNAISNLNYQVFNNADTDFMRIYGQGEDPHTIRYDNRSLRFYNPSGGETIELDRSGNLEIPNGGIRIGSSGAPSGGPEVDVNDGEGVSGDPRIQFNDRALIGYDGVTTAAFLRGLSGKGIRLETDGEKLALKLDKSQNVKIPNGNIDLSSSDGGSLKLGADYNEEIAFGNGSDVETWGDIDFPDVDSANANVRFFRDTSTTGIARFMVYKGDGTDTSYFAVNTEGNGDVEIPNGNLQMNLNSIKNLAAPVDGNDAVRLQYVEGNFVNRTGDTLKGDLDMNDNDIDDIRSVDGGGDAVRVDDNLDLNGNDITSNAEMCVGQYC